MVEGLDSRFTGAFFAGYHARAGQKVAMAYSMILPFERCGSMI
ncbi:D-alanyl-aminopeptidase [Planococcus sp. PAMC 21323]|nr:M55 family metallopeptidase [Planococcus sp. PAMC 21323]AIY06344.1 D-alanyl-aminopeptidase [Planococcus sp. PAMC 21323]